MLFCAFFNRYVFNYFYDAWIIFATLHQEKTASGKTRSDLMKNKRNKVVNKKQNAAGKKAYANIWAHGETSTGCARALDLSKVRKIHGKYPSGYKMKDGSGCATAPVMCGMCPSSGACRITSPSGSCRMSASSGACSMSTSIDEDARGDQCQLSTCGSDCHEWKEISKVER